MNSKCRIFFYVCVYVHTHIFICVHIYLYICVYTYTHKSLYEWVSTFQSSVLTMKVQTLELIKVWLWYAFYHSNISYHHVKSCFFPFTLKLEMSIKLFVSNLESSINHSKEIITGCTEYQTKFAKGFSQTAFYYRKYAFIHRKFKILKCLLFWLLLSPLHPVIFKYTNSRLTITNTKIIYSFKMLLLLLQRTEWLFLQPRTEMLKKKICYTCFNHMYWSHFFKFYFPEDTHVLFRTKIVLHFRKPPWEDPFCMTNAAEETC